MPAVRITGFDGVEPRSSPTMLADSAAQVANNVKLYSKELRYWRGPAAVFTPLTVGVKTMYKLYNGSDYQWLTWAEDVDVVPGPLADTAESRIYFTGVGSPKKTNYALATSGPGPYPANTLEMGVPAPGSPPSVTGNALGVATWLLSLSSNAAANDGVTLDATQNITGSTTAPGETTAYVDGGASKALTINTYVATQENGWISKSPVQPIHAVVATSVLAASEDYNTTGTADVDNRVYVYTNVATFGALQEESAPSPPSSIVGIVFGETCTVSGFDAPPSGAYNITSRRIYRSVTGATTDTYQFVAEIPIATTSFPDALTAAQLGEVLETNGWVPPPADLAGLVALANGSMAGFVGNTVYFSEPYAAHAWPVAYAISVPFPIVGLGVFGNSVVVATTLNPYIITGATPASNSAEVIPIPEPCLARSTITSDEFGVTYASPNGLVGIGPGQRGVVTGQLFRRDEWQAANPASMNAVVFDNKYIGAYQGLYATDNAMVVSRDDKPALSYLYLNASAIFVDSKNAKLYITNASDNLIYEVDSSELHPYTYEWRSKRFTFPRAVAFSALRADADYTQIAAGAAYAAAYAAILAQNAILWGSPLQGAPNNVMVNTFQVNGGTLLNVPLPSASRFLQIQIYADQLLAASLTLNSFDPVRLPPFKARELEIKITGNISLRSVLMATSVPELEQVS